MNYYDNINFTRFVKGAMVVQFYVEYADDIILGIVNSLICFTTLAIASSLLHRSSI